MGTLGAGEERHIVWTCSSCGGAGVTSSKLKHTVPPYAPCPRCGAMITGNSADLIIVDEVDSKLTEADRIRHRQWFMQLVVESVETYIDMMEDSSMLVTTTHGKPPRGD